MLFTVVAAICGGVPRERLFDDSWRFHRGDSGDDLRSGRAPPSSSPFCDDSYDDALWREVDVPHDWSIEVLPSRSEDSGLVGVSQVVSARTGEWQFTWKDDPAFAAASFDDSTWKTVAAPADWRSYALAEAERANCTVGWFRRKVTLDAAQIATAKRGELYLALGTIVDGQEAWLNGKRVDVGADGDGVVEGDVDCEAALDYHRVAFGTDAALRTPTVQIALRVTSSYGATRPGGLFDTGASDGRLGAYDGGASAGQRQTGYSVGGVAWYRKSFDLLRDVAGGDDALAAAIAGGKTRVVVTFDGVYMDSTMWFNSVALGNHPYGYTTFSYELPHAAMNASGVNVLSVKVDNRKQNSRWYSGSGIYRHVRITLLPAFGIARQGVVVTTPSIVINHDALAAAARSGVEATTASHATVVVAVTVVNSERTPVWGANAKVSVSLARSDHPSQIVAQRAVDGRTFAPSSTTVVNVTLAVKDAALWGTANPALYVSRAVTASVLPTPRTREAPRRPLASALTPPRAPIAPRSHDAGTSRPLTSGPTRFQPRSESAPSPSTSRKASR